MTIYRLAENASEYMSAHDLIKAEGFADAPMSFPTVIAYKEGELTGLIATTIKNGYIVAGPIVIKGGRGRYWTFIRLIEYYEKVLEECGVESYLFNVPLSNEVWLDKIRKVTKLEPYTIKDGRAWFVRKLDDGRW